MRLVYADEAGVSNPKHEPYLVVGATVVHADQKLIALERHFDRLVERHIPPEYQDGFVFHAMELFNGGKVFDRTEWLLPRRLNIASDLAAIPKKFQLPVAFGWVERAKFPQTFTVDGMKPRELNAWSHVTAFMSCTMQVEHWMRRNTQNEICVMVVEDNDNARRVIRDTQRWHQNPKHAAMLDEESRKHFPFRKIKQDPLFESKRQSSPLQLADF